MIYQNIFSMGPRINEGAKVELSNKDNGKTADLNVGDILEIELKRSGGTGYEWYLEETHKEHFVLLEEASEEIQAGKHRVGAPVLQRWTMKAVKKGRAKLSLYLYRQWEGKNKSADLFNAEINIK